MAEEARIEVEDEEPQDESGFEDITGDDPVVEDQVDEPEQT